MRRKTQFLRSATPVRRRRQDAEIAPVPTVLPERKAEPCTPTPLPAEPDLTEEAVRRMVEAAYT